MKTRILPSWRFFAGAGVALLVSGCVQSHAPAFASGPRFESAQTLHPGDTLRVSVAGASALDTTQLVRRDGRISLPAIGEVAAADRTPADLQAELRDAYARQLLSSEVTVSVVSAPFTVFVSGAVLRPGRFTPDRAITALEAVMEAGGFDRTRANSRAVVIIRTDGAATRRVTLDLQAVIDGRQTTPFYLESYDIVYVPERFTWF